MSDARTRELERRAGDDPDAAAALARALCRVDGHRLPELLVPLRHVVDGERGTASCPCARCGEKLPCQVDVVGWLAAEVPNDNVDLVHGEPLVRVFDVDEDLVRDVVRQGRWDAWEHGGGF